MGFQNRRSTTWRLLAAVLAVSNGRYLLALSQAAFVVAMALVFFGAEARGGPYLYLTWACLGVGVLATGAAAVV